MHENSHQLDQMMKKLPYQGSIERELLHQLCRWYPLQSAWPDSSQRVQDRVPLTGTACPKNAPCGAKSSCL